MGAIISSSPAPPAPPKTSQDARASQPVQPSKPSSATVPISTSSQQSRQSLSKKQTNQVSYLTPLPPDGSKIRSWERFILPSDKQLIPESKLKQINGGKNIMVTHYTAQEYIEKVFFLMLDEVTDLIVCNQHVLDPQFQTLCNTTNRDNEVFNVATKLYAILNKYVPLYGALRDQSRVEFPTRNVLMIEFLTRCNAALVKLINLFKNTNTATLNKHSTWNTMRDMMTSPSKPNQFQGMLTVLKSTDLTNAKKALDMLLVFPSSSQQQRRRNTNLQQVKKTIQAQINKNKNQMLSDTDLMNKLTAQILLLFINSSSNLPNNRQYKNLTTQQSRNYINKLGRQINPPPLAVKS